MCTEDQTLTAPPFEAALAQLACGQFASGSYRQWLVFTSACHCVPGHESSWRSGEAGGRHCWKAGCGRTEALGCCCACARRCGERPSHRAVGECRGAQTEDDRQDRPHRLGQARLGLCPVSGPGRSLEPARRLQLQPGSRQRPRHRHLRPRRHRAWQPAGFSRLVRRFRSEFSISRSDATPAYVPGDIERGTWKSSSVPTRLRLRALTTASS